MKGRIFPTQSSVLDSGALGRMVERQYRLKGPVTCRFFRKGMTDAYEIKSSTGEYFLKVYMRARRTRRDVEEEVHLLRFLHGRGLSVAAPLRRRDGRYIGRIEAPEGERYAVLFPAAKGVDTDHRKPEDCVSLGRLIGRLHRIADGIGETYRKAPIDLDYLVDRQIEMARPFLRHRARDFELVRRIGAAVKGRIEGLLPRRKPEYGICHGDLHGGDVRIDARGKSTLFDFDSFGYGWRAVEIGVFSASHEWMDLSREAEAGRRRRLRGLLRGYRETRDLSGAELEVVGLAAPVRHIYLMGAVLRYTSTHEGFHWADDNFFNWHMAWFKHWARKMAPPSLRREL